MKPEYALEWYSNEYSDWNEQKRFNSLREAKAERKRIDDIWRDKVLNLGRWRYVKITRKVVR